MFKYLEVLSIDLNKIQIDFCSENDLDGTILSDDPICYNYEIHQIFVFDVK